MKLVKLLREGAPDAFWEDKPPDWAWPQKKPGVFELSWEMSDRTRDGYLELFKALGLEVWFEKQDAGTPHGVIYIKTKSGFLQKPKSQTAHWLSGIKGKDYEKR